MKAIALVLSLLCCFSAAGEATKASVCVLHSGSDPGGPQLAFALREAIRRSAGYQLDEPQKALYRVSLVTLDPDTNGNRTIASVAITMRNTLPLNESDPQTWYAIHLTHFVSITGVNRVDEQARAILATLDEKVELYAADAKK